MSDILDKLKDKVRAKYVLHPDETKEAIAEIERLRAIVDRKTVYPPLGPDILRDAIRQAFLDAAKMAEKLVEVAAKHLRPNEGIVNPYAQLDFEKAVKAVGDELRRAAEGGEG